MSGQEAPRANSSGTWRQADGGRSRSHQGSQSGYKSAKPHQHQQHQHQGSASRQQGNDRGWGFRTQGHPDARDPPHQHHADIARGSVPQHNHQDTAGLATRPSNTAGSEESGPASTTSWGGGLARQLRNASHATSAPAPAGVSAHGAPSRRSLEGTSGSSTSSVAHKQLALPVVPPKFGSPSQRGGGVPEPKHTMQVLGAVNKGAGQRTGSGSQLKPTLSGSSATAVPTTNGIEPVAKPDQPPAAAAVVSAEASAGGASTDASSSQQGSAGDMPPIAKAQGVPLMIGAFQVGTVEVRSAVSPQAASSAVQGASFQGSGDSSHANSTNSAGNPPAHSAPGAQALHNGSHATQHHALSAAVHPGQQSAPAKSSTDQQSSAGGADSAAAGAAAANGSPAAAGGPSQAGSSTAWKGASAWGGGRSFASVIAKPDAPKGPSKAATPVPPAASPAKAQASTPAAPAVPAAAISQAEADPTAPAAAPATARGQAGPVHGTGPSTATAALASDAATSSGKPEPPAEAAAPAEGPSPVSAPTSAASASQVLTSDKATETAAGGASGGSPGTQVPASKPSSWAALAATDRTTPPSGAKPKGPSTTTSPQKGPAPSSASPQTTSAPPHEPTAPATPSTHTQPPVSSPAPASVSPSQLPNTTPSGKGQHNNTPVKGSRGQQGGTGQQHRSGGGGAGGSSAQHKSAPGTPTAAARQQAPAATTSAATSPSKGWAAIAARGAQAPSAPSQPQQAQTTQKLSGAGALEGKPQAAAAGDASETSILPQATTNKGPAVATSDTLAGQSAPSTPRATSTAAAQLAAPEEPAQVQHSSTAEPSAGQETVFEASSMTVTAEAPAAPAPSERQETPEAVSSQGQQPPTAQQGTGEQTGASQVPAVASASVADAVQPADSEPEAATVAQAPVAEQQPEGSASTAAQTAPAVPAGPPAPPSWARLAATAASRPPAASRPAAQPQSQTHPHRTGDTGGHGKQGGAAAGAKAAGRSGAQVTAAAVAQGFQRAAAPNQHTGRGGPVTQAPTSQALALHHHMHSLQGPSAAQTPSAPGSVISVAASPSRTAKSVAQSSQLSRSTSIERTSEAATDDTAPGSHVTPQKHHRGRQHGGRDQGPRQHSQQPQQQPQPAEPAAEPEDDGFQMVASKRTKQHAREVEARHQHQHQHQQQRRSGSQAGSGGGHGGLRPQGSGGSGKHPHAVSQGQWHSGGKHPQDGQQPVHPHAATGQHPAIAAAGRTTPQTPSTPTAPAKHAQQHALSPVPTPPASQPQPAQEPAVAGAVSEPVTHVTEQAKPAAPAVTPDTDNPATGADTQAQHADGVPEIESTVTQAEQVKPAKPADSQVEEAAQTGAAEDGEADADDSEAVPTGGNLFAALADEDSSASNPPANSKQPAAIQQAAQPASPAEAAAAALHQLLFDLGNMAQVKGPAYPPRGFVNTGNSCFVNSPLQALLGCPPFCALLGQLERARTALDPLASPTLHALAVLASQLQAGVTNAPQAGAAETAPTPDSASNVEADGWSQVSKPKGKKGRNAAVPLAVFNGGQAAGPKPASGKQPQSQRQDDAQQQQQRPLGPSAAAAAAALWRQPVIPSSLHEIVRKFSPEYSMQPVGATRPSEAAGNSTGSKTGSMVTSNQYQEQHDAQEFLHFLLDHTHEELLALAKSHPQKEGASEPPIVPEPEEDGEEWAQVGKKNKAAVTRQAGTGAGSIAHRTAINALFAGATKSVIKCGTSKPSATVEPFMMLHLDIELPVVHDLESALAHHLATVTLTDYKPEGSANAAHAVKQLYLYRLPQVLVLHLKRFAYTGSIIKNHKHIQFDTTLKLRKPILCDDCPDMGRGGVAEYSLLATVSHHGKHAAGGHYTADVLQPDGAWLRFNDVAVDLVSPENVLKEQPYILMYQRRDSSGRAA